MHEEIRDADVDMDVDAVFLSTILSPFTLVLLIAWLQQL